MKIELKDTEFIFKIYAKRTNKTHSYNWYFAIFPIVKKYIKEVVSSEPLIISQPYGTKSEMKEHMEKLIKTGIYESQIHWLDKKREQCLQEDY